MVWDNFKNIKGSSGDLLKLEDGKSYKVRIIGEPWVYTSKFNDDFSTRFAVTIYNQTVERAQILMLPKGAFGTIFDLVENEDWGDPIEYDITIKRTGTGLDTEYSIAPSPKKELDQDKIAEVKAIVLDEVLSRLPSVQTAFPLSAVNDMDQLLPPKTKAAKITGGEDIPPDDKMPEDFLQ
jgi:hypothetical protein